MSGKTRRATFSAPPTDIFDRYRHITDRAERAIAFIENECRVPSGRNAAKAYSLLPFQKDLIREGLHEDVITTVWSMPRGAGKTGLVSPLLVFFLYDSEGAQVVSASTGMRTARLAYDRAVRIIELNPDLASQALIFANATDPHVEIPDRGGLMLPLPADEKSTVGFSPTVIVIDEIGYITPEVLEVMSTSLGKVDGSLLIACGTPGIGTTDGARVNSMWNLRTLALSENPPPGLVYVEHAADLSDDPADPKTWAKANPGFGILVDPKVVAYDYATLSAARFGQMRLGIWTQHESAWMSMGTWDALPIDVGPIADGALVTLGFDGSTSGDATALVAYELATGRLVVIGFWARPIGAAGRGWQVPRSEVVETIDKTFASLKVVALYADPWSWRSELQELSSRYADRVLEYNTAARVRMGPATDAFLTAAEKRELRWDGNPALRAHMLSAIALLTPVGDVLTKDARKRQQIDLCIASILAYEAGRLVTPEPTLNIY